MQEALIEEAAFAGATVWRPSRLVSLTAGDPPTAEVLVDGVVENGHGTSDRRCGRPRLTGCASGWVRAAHRPRRVAGGGAAGAGRDGYGDAVNMFIGQAAGQIAAVTRIAAGLYRVYFFHHINAIPSRTSGDRDVGAAFVTCATLACRVSGWPSAAAGAACDVRWRPPVDRAAVRDGVVLVGSAGRATRLGKRSLAHLRDVRLLRDVLTSVKDWPRAADVYAGQHESSGSGSRCRAPHRRGLMSVGPDGASRRARALEVFDRVPNSRSGRTSPRPLRRRRPHSLLA